MEGEASVLSALGVISEVAACAGYAATQSEDLADRLRIIVDAIGADGELRITPAAIVCLGARRQTILDDIVGGGLSPTVPKTAANAVTAAPGAT